MESGNSGSISSSGDEEYECRTDTDQHQHHHHQIQSMMIPSFLNPSLTAAATTQFTSPGLSAHHHHSNIFDHQSSPSNLLHTNTSSFFLNLDSTVPRPPLVMRSDHHQQQQQHLPNPNPNQQFQSVQPNSQLSNHEAIISTSGAAAVPAGAATGGVGGQGSGPRASKKRTRASRRAPTTVLTTDTSNFRAMVQEFTGIPAPPFSASTHFSRRFDLFGTASSGSRSSGLELGSALYPNLVRPSALKPPPPPPHHHLHLHHNQTSPFGGSHMAGPSSSSPLFGNAVTADATSSDQHHHQLGLNVLSMQSQGLGNNMALFQGQSLQVNHLAPSGFDGGDKQTQTQPNLVIDHQHESIMNAAPSNQVSSSEGAVLNIVWRAEPGHDMINYSTSASANTTSSSGFHHGEKQGGLEINNNVASRGEGNVDSWIFPSD